MAGNAKVSSMVRRYITVADLEKLDRGPVYVLNNLKPPMDGQLLLNVPKRNGNGTTLVKLPNTFVPVDLTAQVPRADLVDSAEFRSAASEGKRHLRILNPVYAEALLATADARAEGRRVANEAQAARAAIQSATLGDVSTPEDDVDDIDDEVDLTQVRSAQEQRPTRESRLKVQAAAPVNPDLNAKLLNIVVRANDDTLGDTAIIGLIKNYRVSKKEELVFLANSFKDRKRVIEALRTIRDELRAA